MPGTPSTTFRLEHINIPARDPEGLARWYADTFGLRHDGNKARSDAVLIVFQHGEPVQRSPELHFGLRLGSNEELAQWARKFDAKVTQGPEYNAFRAFDPEGNCVELYCPSAS
jgi:catechol-2,3-dioxygenase